MNVNSHTNPAQACAASFTQPIFSGGVDTPVANALKNIVKMFAGLVARMVMRGARWLQYHRTLRELQALDAHMLKDLGLHHSNLMLVARCASTETSPEGWVGRFDCSADDFRNHGKSYEALAAE